MSLLVFQRSDRSIQLLDRQFLHVGIERFILADRFSQRCQLVSSNLFSTGHWRSYLCRWLVDLPDCPSRNEQTADENRCKHPARPMSLQDKTW